MRALNMVGNESEECPDRTGHHVEGRNVREKGGYRDRNVEDEGVDLVVMVCLGK